MASNPIFKVHVQCGYCRRIIGTIDEGEDLLNKIYHVHSAHRPRCLGPRVAKIIQPSRAV